MIETPRNKCFIHHSALFQVPKNISRGKMACSMDTFFHKNGDHTPLSGSYPVHIQSVVRNDKCLFSQ